MKKSAEIEKDEDHAEGENGRQRSNGGGTGSEEVNPPSQDDEI